MTLGEKIRKLRIEKGLTQDKLAQLLMVSPQAVSRWETGVAAPDISLLVSIANYFEVTTDELLGVDISNKRARIMEYADAYGKFASDLEKSDILRLETIEKLRDGIRLYPDSYLLKSELATTLFINNTDGPIEVEEKREMCILCKELIDETSSIEDKCRYISMYCCYARLAGFSDEGKKLAQLLPETDYPRKKYLAFCCDDDNERNELLESFLGSAWGNLRDAMLMMITEGNRTSENIDSIRKKQEKIYEILFDNDDFVKYEDFDEYKTAKAFYKAGDYQKSIDYLEITLRKWTDNHPVRTVSPLRKHAGYEKSEEEIRVNAKEFIVLVKNNFPDILHNDRVIQLLEKASKISDL